MARASEEVEIKIVVEGSKKAQGQLKGLQGSADSMTKSFFKAGLALDAVRGSIRLASNVIQGAARATANFAKDSIESFQKSEQAMTSLKIIAPRFGVAFEDAQKSARRLGEELRIGVTPAADALQTLLSDGLNLEQAEDLMRRFANEAIIGKAPTIDMATAVQNLALAYKRKSSILGDASGITENFTQIIENGKDSLIKKGMAIKDITEDMAKYEGIILLTNQTEGAFAALSDSTRAKVDGLRQRFITIKETVGDLLDTVLGDLIDYFANTGAIEGFEGSIGRVVDRLEEWWEVNKSKIFVTLDQIIERVKTWWSQNKDNLIPSIEGIINKITSFDWAGFAESVSTIAGAMGWLINKSIAWWGVIGNIIQRVGQFYNIVIDVFSGIAKFISDIWKIITGKTNNELDIMVGKLDKSKRLMTQDFGDLGKDVTVIFDEIGRDGSGTFTQMREDFHKNKNLMIDDAWNLRSNAKNAFDTLVDDIKIASGEASSFTFGSGVGLKFEEKSSGLVFERKARGGIVGQGETTLVGERGPELVKLPAGSRVYTNQQTRGMMQTNNNQKNVTFNGNVNIGGQRSQTQGMNLFSDLLLQGL